MYEPPTIFVIIVLTSTARVTESRLLNDETGNRGLVQLLFSASRIHRSYLNQ
jgi:hypothetical protein